MKMTEVYTYCSSEHVKTAKGLLSEANLWVTPSSQAKGTKSTSSMYPNLGKIP